MICVGEMLEKLNVSAVSFQTCLYPKSITDGKIKKRIKKKL